VNRFLVAFVTIAVAYCAVGGAQSARPKSHVVARVGADVNDGIAVTVAITGGKLLTVTHGVIENGVIVLSGGKITAVGGPGTTIPKGAQIVDARNDGMST
jgi:hypothetical protein